MVVVVREVESIDVYVVGKLSDMLEVDSSVIKLPGVLSVGLLSVSINDVLSLGAYGVGVTVDSLPSVLYMSLKGAAVRITSESVLPDVVSFSGISVPMESLSVA